MQEENNNGFFTLSYEGEKLTGLEGPIRPIDEKEVGMDLLNFIDENIDFDERAFVSVEVGAIIESDILILSDKHYELELSYS